MNPFYLDRLTARYKGHANDGPEALDELVEQYRQYKSASLLDLAAVASTLAIDTLDERALDPLALKAIRDTNPSFDPDKLFGYSDHEWMGIANSAKGKYFEYLVEEKLNHGEAVGDVVLPDDYSAHLAKFENQPEWDIDIVDDHGHTDKFLQLKATDSVGYIHHALETYPDTTILATHEVATHLPHNSMVLDSGISEHEIGQTINASLDNAGEGFLGHFWDAFHPIVPLVLIAGTQGYRVAIGRQSVANAAEVAKARAARALASAGVGGLVKVLGAGWFSIPAAIFTGWIVDRSQNIDDLAAATRRQNQMLGLRIKYYEALVARNA